MARRETEAEAACVWCCYLLDALFPISRLSEAATVQSGPQPWSQVSLTPTEHGSNLRESSLGSQVSPCTPQASQLPSTDSNINVLNIILCVLYILDK